MKKHVELLDMKGMVLYETKAVNVDKIDILTDAYTNGLYFISVSNERAKSIHKLQIIK